MPVQSTLRGNIYYGDSAKCLIKAYGESTFSELGIIGSAIALTVNWEEFELVTANGGTLDTQIRNMSVDGGFTLLNLNPTLVAKMSGGLMEVSTTAGTAVTTMPDQTIAAGWDDEEIHDLDLQTSPTDSTPLRATVKPTFTSITLDPLGTPEVLAEGTEYVIVEKADSTSGYGITFISSGMSTVSPKTFEIVIDYASVTPVARETTYLGHSTKVLQSAEFKFTHTDDNGLIRESHVFAAGINSGGFNFGFASAADGATEAMEISFKGRIDSSRDNGRQLISWAVDNGAA